MRLALALAASTTVSLGCLAGWARGEDGQDDLAKKDDETRALVVSELVKLAGIAKEANAPEKARAELELALLADIKTKEVATELEELRGKTGSPDASFAARWDEERKKAHETCTKALADDIAVLAEKKADERWAACIFLLDRFPGTEVAKRFQVAWFEPYARFFPQADAAKLQAGGELVDGAWIDKAAVTKLDRSHANWESPWIVSDEVHEVRTTASLRTAKTLLAVAGAHRRHFLRRFSGILDLRPPSGGKLPVIATENQADFKARWNAEPRTQGVPRNPNGAAFYLRSGDLSNPCFVTFEPVIGGQVVKVPLEMLESEMAHEVTHQVIYEYMKWDRQGPSTSGSNGWCVEGLATMNQQWKQKGGRWHLAKASKDVSLGGGRTTPLDPAFAWCKKYAKAVPHLSLFVPMKNAELNTAEKYYIAGTLSWFFLEGEGGKYRKPFAKLLDLVHKGKDDEKSFAVCFEGLDGKAIQAEFTKFISEIKLDE